MTNTLNVNYKLSQFLFYSYKASTVRNLQRPQYLYPPPMFTADFFCGAVDSPFLSGISAGDEV